MAKTGCSSLQSSRIRNIWPNLFIRARNSSSSRMARSGIRRHAEQRRRLQEEQTEPKRKTQMKTKLNMLIVVGALLSATAVLAHHSFAATYDADKTIRIEGKLAQFLFRNPHSFIHVIAPDESGNPVRWAVEWQGAGQLNNAGINTESLKPGDPVVINGNPGRNPKDHRMRLVNLKRTTDGFTWGNKPGEVVD